MPSPLVPLLMPRTPADKPPGLLELTVPTTPAAAPAVELVLPWTPAWVPVVAVCWPRIPVPLTLVPITARPAPALLPNSAVPGLLIIALSPPADAPVFVFVTVKRRPLRLPRSCVVPSQAFRAPRNTLPPQPALAAGVAPRTTARTVGGIRARRRSF